MFTQFIKTFITSINSLQVTTTGSISFNLLLHVKLLSYFRSFVKK